MAEPWSRRAGLRPPPSVSGFCPPAFRVTVPAAGGGSGSRRERGVPQRSSSGIFRRGLKVHFEGSCCGRSSGGVLRGLRLRDPRKGFPWKVSAGAPGRMARRHDKRGAPEIPGRPLFLRPGSALPQSARQRRPLQAIMSCSDSLKVSLCSSSSSGRCIR